MSRRPRLAIDEVPNHLKYMSAAFFVVKPNLRAQNLCCKRNICILEVCSVVLSSQSLVTKFVGILFTSGVDEDLRWIYTVICTSRRLSFLTVHEFHGWAEDVVWTTQNCTRPRLHFTGYENLFQCLEQLHEEELTTGILFGVSLAAAFSARHQCFSPQT